MAATARRGGPRQLDEPRIALTHNLGGRPGACVVRGAGGFRTLGWPLMAGDVAPQQVSVAQTLYTALAGGDADRVRDLLDTEFVGRTAPGLPLGLGGTYHGPDDMIGNFWWRLGRTFRARAEPESFDLLPDNRLQVCGTYRGICRPTGRELNAGSFTS